LKRGKWTRSHTFKVSKIIKAPLRYVYNWCTDYREDDPKITGTTTKRKILLRTKNRVIYTSNYVTNGKARTAVNVVTLYPPKAWHLDFIGDEDDEIGDYNLKALNPRLTKLQMKFTEHYKTPNVPTKAQDIAHTREIWDKYVVALERDYGIRKRAH
jgi:hypothetical protein